MPSPASTTVRRTTLPSGIVVMTEEMPHVRTAAFSVTTRRGSRDEAEHESGLSHFLEHFVFRGTRAREGAGTGGALAASPGRTHRDIAIETDMLGGDIDAWTDRESTCYSVEVAADLLPRAAGLLMDMVARPSLDADALERERSVIREEIRGLEEDSEELAFDLSAALAWPEHPLGSPVQGSLASLASFTPALVEAFCERMHVGGNLVCCAAGSLAHDDVVALVHAGLGDLPAGVPPEGLAAPEPASGERVVVREHLDQAQVVLSLPGLSSRDPQMPALVVLASALGGGMSSRLWQRIREEEGLAYSVSFGHEGHRDGGRFLFHATCSPEHLPRTLAIFEEEIARLAREGVPPDELHRIQVGLRSGMLLGEESPGQRLGELAWGELVHGRHLPLEERIDRILAVTPERAAALAARLLAPGPRGLIVITPDAKPLGARRPAAVR